MEFDERLLRKIRMKPVRTISGVTPVTVLTRPAPCPGKCIFCPTDVRMPKSYLHDEPAAMRAELLAFDPFAQVSRRIEAFAFNGHATDKIELLVLGGTWSAYPRDYQERFLLRCFDAMNGTASATLEEAHARNETARHRNVGLVVETRPDHVDLEEVRRLRRLGVTKVQMGAQSLDDEILRKNGRGHTVEETRIAMTRLRAFGLKLVLHWMPNLHGATVASDRADFERLWSDPALRPDEIKIYSTALLANSDLYRLWERGEYTPYGDEELLDLVLDCKERVPEYCRINRLYRDIPSTNIIAGCKMSNMRQHLQERMAREGRRCRCLRCREVRGDAVAEEDLRPVERRYATRETEERFLSFETAGDRLAGYLRLSLPARPGSVEGIDLGVPELRDAALVREVHVYGPSLRLGDAAQDRAQHRGLGTRLLERAERIAREAGYPRVAVIASVGTRPYYAARGYRREGTYMVRRPRDD
ncbi:MAG: tRNA uridine(34) 5-carboxymethylaminomethyl modification radical SAM/GNAT enzyme Elp3 [Candidatus Eisenbacteria bacterium]|nr:tRNA uridine(34) 5-carboxymethylaminomethyl modification radical SAM/GNAT enzyme Elp3 [Candidatus Latescibacterota bacterium]MBD3303495.1 tRNA uridine(34) 5-carboxymethylaminomethyl modification radical SAM/GNAT enzyme Elp3 [Candidatus Eisenbacteria bacterium]